MKIFTPQIGEGRYIDLQDGTSLLRSHDREKLNDRFACLPDAERGRILEEAWFKGPEVYDQIDVTSRLARDCAEGSPEESCRIP